MKRPPGLWLLLSAGVLWLCFQDVSCVRATSLIFGKATTTSTSSTTTTVAPASEAVGEEEGVTEAILESANGTKLSGIPQQDYIYDPNLPREIDNFNLTEYPFYERVPPEDEIDFKCDGLHDGFYASVPHSCQVYHHCLYGTRYDFLCANYTAFDQKTFICHFVSEVDCVNSKNFWHRNDALYQTPTTTTLKPPVVVYTPPAPNPILTGGARRPAVPSLIGRRPKLPPRRRRPAAYDYYDEYEEEADDFYEDPRYTATEAPRSSEGRRRKRPRPRPRPVYDDEYEDYEDERYDRRRGGGGGSRRDDDRPYRSRTRPTRRKQERRKYEDEYDDDDDVDPRFDSSEDRKAKRPRPSYNKRRQEDDVDVKDQKDDRRDKRPSYNKRRQEEDLDIKDEKDDKRTSYNKRRQEEDLDVKDDRRGNKRRQEEDSDVKDDRRGDKRPSHNKRKQEDDDDAKEERPSNPNPKRRLEDDQGEINVKEAKDERRSLFYKRRRDEDDGDKDAKDDKRRSEPSSNKKRVEDDRSETNEKEAKDERRGLFNKRRRDEDDDSEEPRPRPRKGQRRPVEDDYEDEDVDVRRPSRKKESTTEDPRSMVKSSGGSVYDRPRVAPRIRPPSDKFGFKASTSKPPKIDDEEYYDDYEDDPAPPKGKPKGDSSAASNIDSRKSQRPRDEGKPSASRSRGASSHVDEEEEITTRPKNDDRRVGAGSRKKPAVEEYEDYEDDDKPTTTTQSSRVSLKDRKHGRDEGRSKSSTSTTTSTTSTTTTTTTTTEAPETAKPPFRVVKRPFLPSRGGNPYSPRGLQPVGLKSETTAKPESEEILSGKSTESKEYEDTQGEKLFRPSPAVVKVPLKEEDHRPVSTRPVNPARYKQIKEYDSRTTQKPKPAEKNPLDINENEYDVTLNDALNPTLPNLPVRGFPTGFSASNNNDYTFSAFHRPRYVVDATINQASSEYSYRYKAPQRYDPYAIGRTDPSASYSNVNAQNYQNFRPSPRVSHTQAQTYYTTY